MPDAGIGAGTIYAALALRLQGLFDGARQATQVMSELDANMQAAASRASAAASEATTAHARGAAQALTVEENNWRARIALAGRGTAQQKQILTEYLTWLQTQLAKTDITPGMTKNLQGQVASVIRQLETIAKQSAAAQQQMAEQTLRVEMSQWKMRVAATAQGTAEQKAILQQYYTWLQTKVATPGLRPGALTSVNNEIANVTKQINNMGNVTQTVGKNMEATFSRMQRTVGAILAVEAFRYLSTALTQLPQLAFGTSAGFRILERQAEATGQSIDTVHASMEKLAADLKTAKEALAQPVAELMRYGFTVEQIEGIFRGAAASGLLMGKTIDQSIQLVSEALISQRSVLLNEIGVVENLETAMTQYARSLGKSSDELTAAERAQASYQMIVRATASEVKDLPILMEGYGGATAEAGEATYRLKLAVGNALLPAITELKKAFAGIIEALTPFATTIASLANTVIPALVAVIMYRMVVALQALIAKQAEATTGAIALKIALNPIAGVIAAAAAALVYFGIKAAAAGRSTEGFDSALISAAADAEKQADKIDELVRQYDSLISKPQRSAEENKKLKTAMQELAALFPAAVTSWNDHGEAVGIDTDKIKLNSEALRDNAKAQREAELEKAKGRLQKLKDENAALLEQKRIYEELVASIKDATTAEKIKAIEASDLPNYLAISLRYAVAYGQEEKAIANYLATNAASLRDNTVAMVEAQKAVDAIMGRANTAGGGSSTSTSTATPVPGTSDKPKTALELWREGTDKFRNAIELAKAGYGDLDDVLIKYRNNLNTTVADEKIADEVRIAAAKDLQSVLHDLVQWRLDWFDKAKANNDPMTDSYEKQIDFLERLISKEDELQMLTEDRIAVQQELWEVRNAQYEAEVESSDWSAQQQLENYQAMVAAHAVSTDQIMQAQAKVADLTARMSDAAYNAAMDSYNKQTQGLELSTTQRKAIYQREVVDRLAGVKLAAEATIAVELQQLDFERTLAQEQIENSKQNHQTIVDLQDAALRATRQARRADYDAASRDHLAMMAELENRYNQQLMTQIEYQNAAEAEMQKYQGRVAELGTDALQEALKASLSTSPLKDVPEMWPEIYAPLRRQFEEQFKKEFNLTDIPKWLSTQLDELGDEVTSDAYQTYAEVTSYLSGISVAVLQATGKELEAALKQEEDRFQAAVGELYQKRKQIGEKAFAQALSDLNTENYANRVSINAEYGLAALKKQYAEAIELPQFKYDPSAWGQLWTGLRDAFEQKFIANLKLDKIPEYLSTQLDELTKDFQSDATEKIVEIATAKADGAVAALEASNKTVEAAFLRESNQHKANLEKLKNLLGDTKAYNEAYENEMTRHNGEITRIAIDAMTAKLQESSQNQNAQEKYFSFRVERTLLTDALTKQIGAIPEAYVAELDKTEAQLKRESEAFIKDLAAALADKDYEVQIAKAKAAGNIWGNTVADPGVRLLERTRDYYRDMAAAGDNKSLQQAAKDMMEARTLQDEQDRYLEEAQAKIAKLGDVTKENVATMIPELVSLATEYKSLGIYGRTAYEEVEKAQKDATDKQTQWAGERAVAIAEMLEQYNFNMGVTNPNTGSVSLARQIAEWTGSSADLAVAQEKLSLTEQLIKDLIAQGEPLDSEQMKNLFSWWGSYKLDVDNLTASTTAAANAIAAISNLEKNLSGTQATLTKKMELGVITDTDAVKQELQALEQALDEYIANAELAGKTTEETAIYVAELTAEIQALKDEVAEDDALQNHIATIKDLKDAYDEAVGPMLWLEETMAKANGQAFNRNAYMQQFLAQHINNTAQAWLAEGKSIEQVQAALVPLINQLMFYNEEVAKGDRKEATKNFWAGWRADLLQTVGGSFYTALNAGWEAWKVTGASDKLKPFIDSWSDGFKRLTNSEGFQNFMGAVNKGKAAVGVWWQNLHRPEKTYAFGLQNEQRTILGGPMWYLKKYFNEGFFQGIAHSLEDALGTLLMPLVNMKLSGKAGEAAKKMHDFFFDYLPKQMDDMVSSMRVSDWGRNLSDGLSYVLKNVLKLDVLTKYLHTEGMFQGTAHAVRDFADGLNTWVLEGFTAIFNALPPLSTISRMFLNGVMGTGKLMFDIIRTFDEKMRDANDAAQGMGKWSFAQMINPIPALWVTITKIAASFERWASSTFEKLSAASPKVLSTLLEKLDWITSPLQKAFWWMADKLRGAFNWVQDAVTAGAEWMQKSVTGYFARRAQAKTTATADGATTDPGAGDVAMAATAAVAGPAAGIAAVILDILKSTEALKPVFDGINAMFMAMANTIGLLLIPVFKALWPILKGFGLVVGGVAWILGQAWNAIMELFRLVFRAIADFHIGSWHPFAAAGNIADWFDYMKVDTDAIGDELKKLYEMEFPDPGKAFVDGLRDAFKSAFSAGSLVEATQNFGKSLKTTVRDSIITAFMESAAMKPLFDNLSKAISNAMKDGVMSTSEWAGVQNLSEPIKLQMQRLWETLKSLGLIDKSSSSNSGNSGLQVTRLTGESRQVFVDLLQPLTVLNRLPMLFENLMKRADEAVGILRQITQCIMMEFQEATITILQANVLIQSANSVTLAGSVTLQLPTGANVALASALRTGA